MAAGLTAGAAFAHAASSIDALPALVLEGTITQHSFYLVEGVRELETSDFTVVLVPGGWSIERRPQIPLYRVGTNLFGCVESQTVVWDGTELVDWTVSAPELIRRSRNPDQGPEVTIFGRDHLPPNVPDGWLSSLRLLWLAFASGEVLDRSAPDRLPAVWPQIRLRSDPGSRPDDIGTSHAAWARFPQTPRLLERAVFTAERGIRSKTRSALEIPRIYTNGVFEVTSTTNVGGWVIPTEAVARRFEFIPAGRSANQPMEMVFSNLANFTIQVRQARRSETVRAYDLRPRVHDQTSFTDYRFTGRPFHYSDTNWVRADSPKFRAMKAAVVATERSLWLKRFSGMFALIAMGVVSLGFLFFLSRKRQRGIRRKNSEHPRTHRNL